MKGNQMTEDRIILMPDGTTHEAPEPGKDGYTQEQLKEIVDGYVELVYLGDGRLMVVNEDGYRQRLETNYLATEAAKHIGHTIVGPALICLEGDIH